MNETLRGVEVGVDLLDELLEILEVMRAEILSSWIPVVSYQYKRRMEWERQIIERNRLGRGQRLNREMILLLG